MPKLTFKTLFAQSCSEADDWDIDWIARLKLPEDRVTNLAQAEDYATKFARAAEWCGEKIAILIALVEEAKDKHKKTWSEALLYRTGEQSTQPMKKAKADADPDYLCEKAKYNELKSGLEWFTQKQTSFMNGYYAMNNVMKNTAREYPLSGWNTPESAYKTPEPAPQKEEEPDEEKDNFEIDMDDL